MVSIFSKGGDDYEKVENGTGYPVHYGSFWGGGREAVEEIVAD